VRIVLETRAEHERVGMVYIYVMVAAIIWISKIYQINMSLTNNSEESIMIGCHAEAALSILI
jgi:hypothetical protein